MRGQENELILTGVLDGLHEALNILLRGMVCSTPLQRRTRPSCTLEIPLTSFASWIQTDRQGLLNSLEYVILAIDEVVDQGMILELDPQAIASRVLMRGVEGGAVRTRFPHPLATMY